MPETEEMELYGKHPVHGATAHGEPYESPEAYADQGDTRVTRDLVFSYLAPTGEDGNGNPILTPVDLPRDSEVTIDQIGLIALKKGEANHSFYTTEELERRNNPGASAVEITSATNFSELGEYELAEWITNEQPTIDQVLEKVGDDKDLAHRMLQAENIATNGEPRKGLEAGLQAIAAQ